MNWLQSRQGILLNEDRYPLTMHGEPTVVEACASEEANATAAVHLANRGLVARAVPIPATSKPN